MANPPCEHLRQRLDAAEFRVLPYPPGYIGGAPVEATLVGLTLQDQLVTAGAVFCWTDGDGRVHRRAIIATELPPSPRRHVVWREARLDG